MNISMLSCPSPVLESCAVRRFCNAKIFCERTWDKEFRIARSIQKCINSKNEEAGRSIHSYLIKTGRLSFVSLGNNLLNFYIKFNSPNDARNVLEEMPESDVISWTTVITGYVHAGAPVEALRTFQEMRKRLLDPNPYTFATILRASSVLEPTAIGLQLHSLICKFGLESDPFVGSSLIQMYARCKKIEDARLLFDKANAKDRVSWNTMLVGYVHNSRYMEALKLFLNLFEKGIHPDDIAFSSALSACSSLQAFRQGKQIHAQVIIRNALNYLSIGNALTDFYSKCRRIADSWKVFERLPFKNSVTFNALMVGCANNSCYEEALRLYCEMKHKGIVLNDISYSSVLSASARLAALDQGRMIHVDVLKNGFQSFTSIGNTLIDMYSKSGSIDEAFLVFKHMNSKNVVSWTAMLSGCAQHGLAMELISLFAEMQDQLIEPDHITFVCLLSACSHLGLVKEGQNYFEAMSRDYGIKPTAEHYACMVDLLCRAGHLKEAKDLILSMPFDATVSVWGALLSACRIHLDTDLAVWAAENLLRLEPQNTGNYVLLSNIFAGKGRWKDVSMVRKLMDANGARKEPGCSWVEVRNTVHSFVVGDKSHPQSVQIYAELERLVREIRKYGYVPDTSALFYDLEEDQKEDILLYHSEKLALAFALISTRPCSPIRIKKNLRVCTDCHTAIKFISKITKRDILVRDNMRFHHFREGTCSCRDYW